MIALGVDRGAFAVDDEWHELWEIDPDAARAFEVESGRWAAVRAIWALQAEADRLRQISEIVH